MCVWVIVGARKRTQFYYFCAHYQFTLRFIFSSSFVVVVFIHDVRNVYTTICYTWNNKWCRYHRLPELTKQQQQPKSNKMRMTCTSKAKTIIFPFWLCVVRDGRLTFEHWTMFVNQHTHKFIEFCPKTRTETKPHSYFVEMCLYRCIFLTVICAFQLIWRTHRHIHLHCVVNL